MRCVASASARSRRSSPAAAAFAAARSRSAASRQARSSAAPSCCRFPASCAHAMAACVQNRLPFAGIASGIHENLDW